MPPIKIRDLRQKEKFVVDDAYLNGYARLCGIYATGVYMSLCRHAGKNQTSFPSIKLIAQELAISETTVKRALAKLVEWQIIARGKRMRRANQAWMNNTYVLLDKTLWLAKPGVSHAPGAIALSAPTQGSLTHQSQGSVVPTKETHSAKETHRKEGEEKEKKARIAEILDRDGGIGRKSNMR